MTEALKNSVCDELNKYVDAGMFLCMYHACIYDACIYVYNVCLFVCFCLRSYAFMYLSVSLFVHCVCLFIYACMYVHMYVNMCVFVCVCARRGTRHVKLHCMQCCEAYHEEINPKWQYKQ